MNGLFRVVGPHQHFADEDSIESRLTCTLSITDVPNCTFCNHNIVDRKTRPELECLIEMFVKGCKVSCVDSEYDTSDRPNCLSLGLVVNFDEHIKTKLQSESSKVSTLVGTTECCSDEQYRIGTGDTSLKNLWRIDNEVLAQDREQSRFPSNS